MIEMMTTQPDPRYEQLERRLAEWAAGRDDVRAVVVIGSRARATRHPPDAWSDLDAIVFVDDWRPYLQPGEWQTSLEAAFEYPVWFAELELNWPNDPEYEYVLEGGLKADLLFVFNPSPRGRQATLAEMCELSPMSFVFGHAARVLLDKTPGGEYNPPPAAPEPLPGQAEFDNCIAGVLLELVRSTTLNGRGELWRAAEALNGEIRPHLLALLEWQARTRPEPGRELWTYGRFLEEWADARALAALPATYSDSTPEGTRRAIRATLELLSWLGPQVAGRLGLVYPAERVRVVSEWMGINPPVGG